jgi:hypothetical protein
MRGLITGRDVVLHTFTIIRLWGLPAWLRCLRATLSIPSLAGATPGDAHDDSTYPTSATESVHVPGPVAGPKALAFDDATYPDVATGQESHTGIAMALTDGPEPYAHDDVTYAAPPSESNANGGPAVASAW